MKTYLSLAICLIVFPLLSFRSGNSGTEMTNLKSWQWELAKKKAGDQNKIIFVKGYADYCLPCKFMDENVFTDPEVIEFFNENFINMLVDVKTEEGKWFKEKYDLEVLPAMYFFTPDGKLISAKNGSLDKTNLMKWATMISKK